MTSRHGRKIHPFRTSGVNEPGYSRPAQQPTQQPAREPERPKSHFLTIGHGHNAQRVQARLDAATDVTLGDPPRIAAAHPAVTVHLDSVPFRLPLGWAFSASSPRGKDVLYALDDKRVLHVLIVDGNGDVREIQGMPADLIADLIAYRFPRRGR
ncbi:hypothetical protein [Microbacterium phyllosphaerae]|uniref:hypothetical protein n=1 Tax=Microbacterium phyllosphaerae TaxID=124798 RepID=UPI003D6584DD